MIQISSNMKTFKTLHPNSKKDIRLDEIVRIEADINYSHLIHKSGTKFILARTLKAYEKILVFPFLRVNKSCMINLNYLIENAISENKSLRMIDGQEIKISRRRIQQVNLAIESIKY